MRVRPLSFSLHVFPLQSFSREWLPLECLSLHRLTLDGLPFPLLCHLSIPSQGVKLSLEILIFNPQILHNVVLSEKYVRFEIFPLFLQLCWGYCATFEYRPHYFHGLNCCSFGQVCSDSACLALLLSRYARAKIQACVPCERLWVDCWTFWFITSWTGIQADEQLS